MTTLVVVSGLVEYRMGDGPLCAIPQGPAEVETSPTDVTVTWGEGETRQSAALPADNFLRYVSRKAITID